MPPWERSPSGIAHEINNPLAYITANLAYLEEELADPKTFTDPARLTEVRHAIHEARDGAQRVRNIVTDMRALARGDRMHRPVDVTLVLKSAVAALSSEIRARARLTTRFVPVPLVKGNEARLGQVFIGLLLNAYDAITTGTPEDHEITIATSVDAQQRVVIEVHDTGIGIPPQLHERIFDPFFSANPRGKGKGLGLAICHHIITDLGGTISVESAPARGSLFRVALPAVTEGVDATGPTTIRIHHHGDRHDGGPRHPGPRSPRQPILQARHRRAPPSMHPDPPRRPPRTGTDPHPDRAPVGHVPRLVSSSAHSTVVHRVPIASGCSSSTGLFSAEEGPRKGSEREVGGAFEAAPARPRAGCQAETERPWGRLLQAAP